MSKEEEKNEKNMLERYGQTIIIILSILTTAISSCAWMNSKFNNIDHRLTVIETVLVMKNIMPAEMAKTENK